MSTNNDQSIWANAVCLSLCLRKPGFRRKGDKDEIETSADKEQLHLSKDIIDCPEYAAIGRLDTLIKAYVKNRALPCKYMRGGMYPITLQSVESMDERLDEFAIQRTALVESFLTAYPAAVQSQVLKLVDQYSEADYPTIPQLRAGFSIDRQYISFDTPSNLKKLGDKFWKREQAKAESSWASATKTIEHAMAEGLQQLVSHLVDRLKPGEDGKQKRFHKSAVSNITEFLSTFRDRQITNDDELLAVVKKAEAVLGGVDSKELRKDGAFRRDMQNKMTEIGEQLGNMVETRARKITFAAE